MSNHFYNHFIINNTSCIFANIVNFCVGEFPYSKIFYDIKRIYLVDIKRLVKYIINAFNEIFVAHPKNRFCSAKS